MTIDYSKWDHIECSDDEGPKRPRVTHFDQPQTIQIGNSDSEPLDLTTGSHKPTVGDIYPEYAWDQTGKTVDIFLRLPKCSQRPKTGRSVRLICEEPPETLMQGRHIPASLTTSDLFQTTSNDEDFDTPVSKEDLFPVAWGIEIIWPVDKDYKNETAGLWSSPDTDQNIRSVLYFPYPISNIEDSWNWVVEQACPYNTEGTWSDPQCIHISVTKKTSRQLFGVDIWWEQAFLGRVNESISIAEKRPAQAVKSNAFTQIWEEAHAKFRENVRNRVPIDLSEALKIDHPSTNK